MPSDAPRSEKVSRAAIGGRCWRFARYGVVRYSAVAMDERFFRDKCDLAMEQLRRKLLDLSDRYPFEVEGEGDKLELQFEDADETRFVISPNSAARQIWISALTTSFKLGWSEAAQAFTLEKSGETLEQLMGRILSQQLGEAIEVGR